MDSEDGESLLWFFRCVCHLEDSEVILLALLLDALDVQKLSEFRNVVRSRKIDVVQCFEETGLSDETLAHVLHCLGRMAEDSSLRVRTKAAKSQIGLSCIDTPTPTPGGGCTRSTDSNTSTATFGQSDEFNKDVEDISIYKRREQTHLHQDKSNESNKGCIRRWLEEDGIQTSPPCAAEEELEEKPPPAHQKPKVVRFEDCRELPPPPSPDPSIPPPHSCGVARLLGAARRGLAGGLFQNCNEWNSPLLRTAPIKRVPSTCDVPGLCSPESPLCPRPSSSGQQQGLQDLLGCSTTQDQGQGQGQGQGSEGEGDDEGRGAGPQRQHHYLHLDGMEYQHQQQPNQRHRHYQRMHQEQLELSLRAQVGSEQTKGGSMLCREREGRVKEGKEDDPEGELGQATMRKSMTTMTTTVTVKARIKEEKRLGHFCSMS